MLSPITLLAASLLKSTLTLTLTLTNFHFHHNFLHHCWLINTQLRHVAILREEDGEVVVAYGHFLRPNSFGGIKGGIVRFDEKSEELCICTDSYSYDIQSNSWRVLREVIR